MNESYLCTGGTRRILLGRKSPTTAALFPKTTPSARSKNQTNTRFLTLLLLQAQPVPYCNDGDTNQKAVSIQSVFSFSIFFFFHFLEQSQ